MDGGGKKTLLFCCFERDEVFFFSRARAPLNIPLLSFFKGRTTEKAKFSSLCLLRRVEAFEKLTLSPLKKKKKKHPKKTPELKTQKKTIRWLKTRSACPLCNKEWEFAKIEKILQGGDGAAGGGG